MTVTASEPAKQDMPDPLRHYDHYQDGVNAGSPYAGGSSFMERLSGKVASGWGRRRSSSSRLS